ncbi:Conserved membrane protein [Labilithrix luteola]|uniref:Conserved membrane protein n=1 Tax=Labilithrix luteola TaxID=1391654 RepID=A0A0K1Q9I7_9BACT|nr:glycosyltransferase family 39 protein [Labilithrix luteola]AKV02461.1 Conserved membrane protein [Labilithrix luteola]
MTLRRAPSDSLVVVLVALVARLAVVLWAGSAIPPTADGSYYDVVARRIAEGHGYTWLWPDGAVTYAAHYPVGYPALVAGMYALFGARPVLAMVLNAVAGTAAVFAGYRLLARATSRRLALLGGLAFALHPALVPYTAALMTEGMTAALLVVATATAARARDAAERGDSRSRWRWLALTGLVMGLVTLVRPQSLAYGPVLGLLAATPKERLAVRGLAAVLVTALTFAVCAPWTVRNCVRMERCALVSVNGGWNLAIGTQTTNGAWQEMKVPEACKEVFAEAAKDACFGHEAVHVIEADPLAWLARVPAKMRATFDYFGAAPWYLHQANATRFPYGAKVALGTVETLASRLLLAAALVAVLKFPGPRKRARIVIAALGLAACVVVPGTVGYLACAAAILLLGPRALARAPVILPATAATILLTAATHAVFFGAGRYGLVVVPFVTLLAFVRATPEESAPRHG